MSVTAPEIKEIGPPGRGVQAKAGVAAERPALLSALKWWVCRCGWSPGWDTTRVQGSEQGQALGPLAAHSSLWFPDSESPGGRGGAFPWPIPAAPAQALVMASPRPSGHHRKPGGYCWLNLFASVESSQNHNKWIPKGSRALGLRARLSVTGAVSFCSSTSPVCVPTSSEALLPWSRASLVVLAVQEWPRGPEPRCLGTWAPPDAWAPRAARMSGRGGGCPEGPCPSPGPSWKACGLSVGTVAGGAPVRACGRPELWFCPRRQQQFRGASQEDVPTAPHPSPQGLARGGRAPAGRA